MVQPDLRRRPVLRLCDWSEVLKAERTALRVRLLMAHVKYSSRSDVECKHM